MTDAAAAAAAGGGSGANAAAKTARNSSDNELGVCVGGFAPGREGGTAN